MQNTNYGGFWVRVGASLIDTAIMLVFLVPLATMIYGIDYWTQKKAVAGAWDLVLNYLLPALVVILFWRYKSATPGKMALKLVIVDAASGGTPTTRQLVIRYLGYFVSTIPFCLGLIWVGVDKKKQGWHDKMAGTLVVKQ